MMRYMLLIAALLVVAGSAYGATINVPADYATIQAAVDAASNDDEIRIAAGTYVEQLNINKRLTLQGAGTGSTIVESPALITQSFVTGTYTNKPAVLVRDCNAFIKNLTFDGAGRGNGNYRFIGIAFVNAGGSVTDCEIKNVRDTPFSGSQHGVGVAAYNLDAAARDFLVGSCYFHDNQKTFLVVSGAGLTVDVQYNTFRGIGPTGVTAQNGIQLSPGVTGSVTWNEVSGFYYTGPSWAASAILSWGDNVNFNNNIATLSNFGLYVDTAAGATIHNNNLVGNDWGLLSNCAGTANATGNWWGVPNGPRPEGSGNWVYDYKSPGTLDVSSPLAKPAQSNALYLQPEADSIYIRPTETATINLNVANLTQMVSGLQAMLNFSSTYFSTESGDVFVAPGGGDWDELIYNVWNAGGDLDVAVGVKLTLSDGTNADARTAYMTLTPTGTEGVTQVIFRPNLVPDPGLIASTFLSDTAGAVVWPTKVNSTSIYIDGTAPVITCPASQTVSTDPDKCYATVDVGEATATDAVSDVESIEGVRSDGQPLDATYPKGVTTITWTATDFAGNSADCVQTITVNDTQKPTITAPADIVVGTDPGLCSATVSDLGAPTTGDNCGVESVTNDHPSTTYPKGTTTVTWTVTDTSGNTETATQTVTVNDTEAPAIPDHVDIPANNDPGVCSAVVTWAAISATDNCDGTVAVTCVPASGSTFPKGETTVTMSATDAAGNAAVTKTFKVIVTDNEKPVVTDATAAPTCVRTQDVTITAVGADNCTAPGSLVWEHKVGSGSWAAGLTVSASELAEGLNTLCVQAKDESGNYSDEFAVTNQVSKDTTAPAISNIKAEQGGSSVLCPAEAVQGLVDIYVDVAEVGCAGLVAPPTVEVAGMTVSYTGVSGDTFHYQATVGTTTSNGSHPITVTAIDNLGNQSVDSSKSLCVDKNQITGTVSYATYVSTAYTVARDVVFVATDSGGAVLKTWTASVSFVNDAVSAVASGGFTLNNVPAGTARLSAKTVWHLRKRLDVALDGNGQASASITLLGGDINNSNSVNVLDYSIMKTSWGAGAAGDINGHNGTGTVDYSIMKSNWFVLGDPQ